MVIIDYLDKVAIFGISPGCLRAVSRVRSRSPSAERFRGEQETFGHCLLVRRRALRTPTHTRTRTRTRELEFELGLKLKTEVELELELEVELELELKLELEVELEPQLKLETELEVELGAAGDGGWAMRVFGLTADPVDLQAAVRFDGAIEAPLRAPAPEVATAPAAGGDARGQQRQGRRPRRRKERERDWGRRQPLAATRRISRRADSERSGGDVLW